LLFNDCNRWRAYRYAAGIIDDIARLGGINHQFLVSAYEGSYCMQFKAGKSLLRVKQQPVRRHAELSIHCYVTPILVPLLN